MKKLMSLLILFAILLSVCACGAQEAPQATTTTAEPAETTPATQSGTSGLQQLTDEDKFGHINQLEPVDGVYKIWNAEGVKNIANHPDAKFELLCTIDMEGTVLAPIGADKPFTGELKGSNFFIKNFTVQGGNEENFGFISVNQGTVRNLVLENVTFIPGANAKNIGTAVGLNEGTVTRCNVTGAMTVEAAAADAACGGLAGRNTGTLANMVCTVDLVYTAAGTANVGGLVGVTTGGTAEFLENHGVLTVTGDNKTTGLFAGTAENTVFNNCVFGGADNSLNGELFVNFTGNEGDDEYAVALKAKWRDNAVHEQLPENVMALRQKVVDTMYDLCTVEWRVTQDLVHSCTCQLSSCHGTYSSNFTYYGIPYNHKASSLARFTYCLNEDKTLFDWFYDLATYDGFDIYIGSDCSSTMQQAWWSVSNSTNICNTTYIPAAYGHGTIAVGPYKCDFELKTETRDGVATLYTAQYIEANEEQTIYESYAAMRFGDAMVNKVAVGGHTRMVAADPVVIKTQDGLIDPAYSYVLMHEQGATWLDEVRMVTSSCKTDWKYTFAALYSDCYVPVTCEELLTGEMEPAEAQILDGCDGFAGMFTGTVKANYQLDYVKLTITDGEGNEVLDHPVFTTSQKSSDYGGNYFTARMYTDSMDLADFAVVLTKIKLEEGKTYQYTLTACLATFDSIVVGEGTFAYGAVS